jgi:Uma2 family endonuclease
MPAASTVKLTVDQYRALGEDPPGVRLELVDGEIEVSPSPAPQHDDTTFLLRSILHAHVVTHDLGRVQGDVDTPLDAHNVRRPDIMWFRRERLDLVTKDRLLGLPDLAVEVISPGSVKTDRQTKFEVPQGTRTRAQAPRHVHRRRRQRRPPPPLSGRSSTTPSTRR